ncbi:MAG TPA: hypothetical protein O0W90_00040, partial [Methanocorpusculum sp.]|nr:hypothetical protein [Methanocorpusculum sp.]
MKRDFCNRYEKLPFKAILLSMLIIFVCASAFCGCVSAVGESNYAYVSDFTELKTNLSNSTIDHICLLKDIKLDDNLCAKNKTIINIDNTEVTIDLNGKSIYFNNTTEGAYNRFQIINGGKLKVNDSKGNGGIYSICNDTMFLLFKGSLTLESGTFKATMPSEEYNLKNPKPTIQISSSSEESSKDYTKFTLGKDAILEVNGGSWPIAMYQNSTTGYGIVVDITGKIQSNYSGITINGQLQPTTINENVPQIHIHDGAVINAPCAVYGAGYGNWTFEGCTITGDEVLSIKSGNWTINSGTFTCDGIYYDPAIAWDSGSEPSGAAVSITHNPNYKCEVELTINGGTFTSVYQSALFEGKDTNENSKSALGEKGITINGGEFITKNTTLYPIYIRNLNGQHVSVSLNGQTPLYPGLNTSSATWVNDTDNNWNVTLNGNIENVMSIDLRHVPSDKKVTLKGSYNFVKVVNDDKYSFDGWSHGAEKLPASTIEFAGGVEYKPIFTYIKQYDTGEEVEDDEPTPIVTPTPTQNQTAKPTVKPTPEPKTV